MKVGIIQSNYIPWRGYFDFIKEVDLFIFFDDVQYTDRDWRNRNKIKTPYGLKWLTVPVKYYKRDQLIMNTAIDYSSNWQKKHINLFRENYKKSSGCDFCVQLLEKTFTLNHETISQLNQHLTAEVCDYLSITTPFINASDLKVEGTKTGRLIALLKKVNASSYLSGPSSKAYLDEQAFERDNIKLEYKSYDYEAYPQLHPPFEQGVSILDYIANTYQTEPLSVNNAEQK